METKVREMLRQAKLEVEVAENHLNWALSDDDIDICVYKLSAAIKRLNTVIKLAKEVEQK